MAPVPPGNLVFLQVQQTRLVHHLPHSDEYATHISQYESPFQKIHFPAGVARHCRGARSALTRYLAPVGRFLERHPQLVTLVLLMGLVWLLHILFSMPTTSSRKKEPAPETKRPLLDDTSSIRKEG